MARKRAVKQRLDLRKGGSVKRLRAIMGYSPSQRRELLGQDPIPGDPTYVAPTTPAPTIADRAATVATTTEPEAGDFGRQPGEYPDAGTKFSNGGTATDTSTKFPEGKEPRDPDRERDEPTMSDKMTSATKNLSVTTDRGFGERTTTTADPVSIDVAQMDSSIAGDTFQMEDRTPTASPEDVTAQQITSAQGTAAQAAQQEDIQAAQMTAEKAGELGEVQAATGQVTREAEAEGPTLTERAVPDRDWETRSAEPQLP